MPVQSQEINHIFVLGVSILSLSTILIFDFLLFRQYGIFFYFVYSKCQGLPFYLEGYCLCSATVDCYVIYLVVFLT